MYIAYECISKVPTYLDEIKILDIFFFYVTHAIIDILEVWAIKKCEMVKLYNIFSDGQGFKKCFCKSKWISNKYKRNRTLILF